MATSKCASIPAIPSSRWRTWTLQPPNEYPSSSLTGYPRQSRISLLAFHTHRASSSQAPSIRSHSLKRPRPSAIMERPIKRIPLHHAIHPRPIHAPAKHQHVPRLRLHHKMLHIDSPFHAARLIRPLEVPRDHRSLLLQIQILRRSRSIRILAVQSPLPRSIRRHLLRRRSLPQRHASHHHPQNQAKHPIAQSKSLHESSFTSEYPTAYRSPALFPTPALAAR